MIRIKQKTANVCEHTNVNIVIIANVVHLLKTSNWVFFRIEFYRFCNTILVILIFQNY